jgi:hypothetical protein
VKGRRSKRREPAEWAISSTSRGQPNNYIRKSEQAHWSPVDLDQLHRTTKQHPDTPGGEIMALTDMKRMQEKATESFQEATDAAADATQRAAGAVDDNVRTFAEMSTVLASGFQEVSREWWRLSQNRLKINLELTNKLLSCRTVPEALSVQSELAKSTLEQFLNDTRRLLELSMSAMGKVANHAEGNMERATDQTRRAA